MPVRQHPERSRRTAAARRAHSAAAAVTERERLRSALQSRHASAAPVSTPDAAYARREALLARVRSRSWAVSLVQVGGGAATMLIGNRVCTFVLIKLQFVAISTAN